MPETVVARVVRSGFVESTHRGVVVVLDAAGEVVLGVGDGAAPVFPRSATKPLQTVAMLRAGLDLDGELLALATSSHSGEAFHRDGVAAILAGAGLGLDALRTTPALPLEVGEAASWLAGGRVPEPVAHGCSGKHAAMLATCVFNGWPTDGHLDAAHPLQVAIAEGVADLAGERPVAVGVDGCGAPTFAISPVGLARAYGRIAAAPAGTPEARLARAVREHPQWLGGTGREVTAVLRAVPGLFAKDGVEGVAAAALPDGTAVAVKIADGSDRAAMPVLLAALRQTSPATFDADLPAALAEPAVLGHGRPVGSLVVTLGA